MVENSFSLEEGVDVNDVNFFITWETNLCSLLVVTPPPPPRSMRALESHIF